MERAQVEDEDPVPVLSLWVLVLVELHHHIIFGIEA